MNTTPTNASKGETTTVNLAKEKYGVAGHNLRRWLRDKKIAGHKEGKEYLIDVKSLERFLADQGKQRQSPEPAAANGHDVPAPASAPEAGKLDAAVDLHGPATSSPDKEAAKASRKEDDEKKRSKPQRAHKRPARTNNAPTFKNINHRRLNFSKDGMRKFNLAELRRMRDWIVQRMDRRAKLA